MSIFERHGHSHRRYERGEPQPSCSSAESERFTPEEALEESEIEFFCRPIKMEPRDPLAPDEDEDLMHNNLMDSSLDPLLDHSNFTIPEDGCQVVIHMDIREPLSSLRSLIEEKVGKSLHDFGFSLQDAQILDEHKNLVDQCVQGEGIVQINCELKGTINYGKRINILDVLKPAEEYVEILGGNDSEDTSTINYDQNIRWIVDPKFKKDQEKLGIPQDPAKWSPEHVRHWLMWAVRQFNLSGIDLSKWAIPGADLSKITQDEFRQRVPRDPFNSFWTHFELLRKCKIVAVNPSHRTEPQNFRVDPGEGTSKGPRDTSVRPQKSNPRNTRMTRIIKPTPTCMTTVEEDFEDEFGETEFRTYSMGGPIQLWQFLLELLTDRRHRNAIQWLQNDGEFKLVNPELVAHLWGLRKNKPTMNYEKLSRALRYYYDGDMISKVHGQRCVYKYVCDLKMMVGYSASELNALVIEAELRALQRQVKRRKLS